MNRENRKQYYRVLEEMKKLDDGLMAELKEDSKKLPTSATVKLAMEYSQVVSAKTLLESVT